MRLGHVRLWFFTKRRNLHPSLQQGCNRSTNRWIQAQMFTRIGTCNARYGTGLAKITRPILTCGFKQAAFFRVSAAEIITIKMRALSASGSFHTKLPSKRRASSLFNYPATRPIKYSSPKHHNITRGWRNRLSLYSRGWCHPPLQIVGKTLRVPFRSWPS